MISVVIRGEHERPRRRRRAEKIVTDRKTPADRPWDGIFAIVTGLTVAVVGALLVYFGTPLIEAQLRAPSCDDPRGLKPITVGAPTSDSPDAVLSGYELEHLVDADVASAWVEGVGGDTPSTNLGQGLTLTFTLPGEGADLQMICIVNGYSKSWKTFQQNASIRLTTVSTDAGPSLTSGLDAKQQANFASFELLDFSQGPTQSVVLRIDSARQGSFENPAEIYSDLAVSEIEFWVNP